MNAPKRAFVISVEAAGDTFEDAKQLLEHLVDQIHEQAKIAHGSPSAGGFLTVVAHPEMTHEKYHAELKAYLANQE